MLSPLQLDNFSLEHLTIARGKSRARGEKMPEEIDYAIRVDFGSEKLRSEGGRPRYSVSLAFEMESQEKEKSVPVGLVLAGVTGEFSFAVDTPEELLEQLVPANCLAILYGILRGIVIQTTSGCAGGCFILPALSIGHLIALKESRGEVTETVTALASRPRGKSGSKTKKRTRKRRS